MTKQKGSWIDMENKTFYNLPHEQQQEILKIIKSDFTAAKRLYLSYTSKTCPNINSEKSDTYNRCQQ
ncbi:MAG: hypothetical protein VX335_01285 [Pseudomonadota bacterium]|nr:hypothetical protein [Pseudomonadota bacterium]